LCDNVAAHCFEDVWKVRLPLGIFQLGQAESVTQNAGICIAAERYSVEYNVVPHNGANARIEGVEMDSVATPQERTIDIE
jgi:hypothetical protein